MDQIYILALLWIVWCCLHSLAISRFFIRNMKSRLGTGFCYYRIAYNGFSLLTLIPIVIYQLRLPEKILFAWTGFWIIPRIGMYLISFVLFVGGYRAYDIGYVLGLKQAKEARNRSGCESMDFNTTGILRYVRHPWYSGAIILIWAFGPISAASLVTKIILTGYIIVGTFLEEKKLIHMIGEPYLRYRGEVPMLIPWKK